MRQVRNDYTFRFGRQLYQIERAAIVAGLRAADVRIDKRLDGTVAVRYREKYLPVEPCAPVGKPASAPPPATNKEKRPQSRRGSDWNRNLDLNKAPKRRVPQATAPEMRNEIATRTIRKWRERQSSLLT
jgi:hypothetical protein